MNPFFSSIQVRWADLDPNFHLRHSAYYDYGAQCRVEFLQQHGITAQFMLKNHFGPILFREECVFKREIRLADPVKLDLKLVSATRDFSRWTMQHHLIKNVDELAAIITVEGAWMDTQLRKLVVPPAEVLATFQQAPLAPEFSWAEKNK